MPLASFSSGVDPPELGNTPVVVDDHRVPLFPDRLSECLVHQAEVGRIGRRSLDAIDYKVLDRK